MMRRAGAMDAGESAFLVKETGTLEWQTSRLLPRQRAHSSMSQIEREVDKLRDEFESNTEWQLRREFLLANYESLPQERLVCMSRVFVNVEQYGCLYPDAVMQQLRELSAGVKYKVQQQAGPKGAGGQGDSRRSQR